MCVAIEGLLLTKMKKKRKENLGQTVSLSVEQGMLMSEIFPSCSPQWEDLRALSHAAVKDSCHPVSGSNTRTHTHAVNEKRGFEAKGRRRSQVKEKSPPTDHRKAATRRHFGDQKKEGIDASF